MIEKQLTYMWRGQTQTRKCRMDYLTIPKRFFCRHVNRKGQIFCSQMKHRFLNNIWASGPLGRSNLGSGALSTG